MSNKIEIKRNTAGDSRVANKKPTIEEFVDANWMHRSDVKNIEQFFARELNYRIKDHDWTKVTEPYKSMFYRDMRKAIDGEMDFMEGEWVVFHYEKYERHHLTRFCPDDVNMIDVLEMIFDCVAAGAARHGKVYDVEIPAEILTKAVSNTVDWLTDNIKVIPEG